MLKENISIWVRNGIWNTARLSIWWNYPTIRTLRLDPIYRHNPVSSTSPSSHSAVFCRGKSIFSVSLPISFLFSFFETLTSSLFATLFTSLYLSSGCLNVGPRGELVHRDFCGAVANLAQIFNKGGSGHFPHQSATFLSVWACVAFSIPPVRMFLAFSYKTSTLATVPTTTDATDTNTIQVTVQILQML